MKDLKMKIGTRLVISDPDTILTGAEVVVTDTIREGRYLCQIVKLPQSDKFKKSGSFVFHLGRQVYVSNGQYEQSPQQGEKQ
jgi:hypothetical protein